MLTSRGFRDLNVYKLAFKLAMEIFEESKRFPKEEKYSLTDQIRRSSRSVPGNIGEGYRKKRYPKFFVLKLLTRTGKAQKPKSGSILQQLVATYPKNVNTNGGWDMKKLEECSVE